MKMKIAGLAFAAALLTVNATQAAATRNSVNIEAGESLYVRIIDMMSESIYYDRDIHIRSENDRYHYLIDSIGDVFDEAELPVVPVFVRSGARLPKDAVVLNIFLHQWELNRLGEYGIRFATQLTGSGMKESLGIKDGSCFWGNPFRYRIVDNFQTSARRATTKLIAQIAQRITESN